MMPPYEQARDWLGSNTGGFYGAAAVAAMWASLWASILSLPFDNLKTKMQAQVPGSDGKLMYRTLSEAYYKTLAREGFGGFYVGFCAYYLRVAPHAIITLYTIDRIQYLLNKK